MTTSIRSLKEGDRTPWYEVLEGAIEDESAQGWYSVRVHHFTSERDGHVHQCGSDSVPIELRA